MKREETEQLEEENTKHRKKIDDTERNRKKQEEKLRNGKKREETGRDRKRREEIGRDGKRRCLKFALTIVHISCAYIGPKNPKRHSQMK